MEGVWLAVCTQRRAQPTHEAGEGFLLADVVGGGFLLDDVVGERFLLAGVVG